MLDVATERQAPLLALLGLQGLRISEACGVVWSDIDLDGATLHVQAQLGPDGKRTPLLKTEGRERMLKLDGRTLSILRSWKAKQMTLGLHRPDDFVLATSTGKPTKRRQAHRTLQGVARRAKLINPGESFRPHDLRSGFAVAALLAGDPPNLVQRMLGHSTAAMTMDLYGKLKGQEAVGTRRSPSPRPTSCRSRRWVNRNKSPRSRSGGVRRLASTRARPDPRHLGDLRRQARDVRRAPTRAAQDAAASRA